MTRSRPSVPFSVGLGESLAPFGHIELVGRWASWFGQISPIIGHKID